MELLFGVIVGLALLIFLVVIHELGHAVAAIRSGVVVEEFGIGFPPLACKKKLKNKILFTLNWLPLGGYVKLQGEYDSASEKGDYGAATFWQKTKILFAGVFINWLAAAVILSLLALVGMPKVLPDQFSVAGDTKITSQAVQITNLTSGHPAEKVGLKPGDKIIKFSGQDVTSVEELIAVIKENKNKTVDITYDRDGTENTVSVPLGAETEGGILGAGLGQREFIKATWSAPIVGVATTIQFTGATFQGLGDLFVNLFNGIVMQFSNNKQAQADLAAVSDSVAGPIGILGTIFPAASQAGPVQLMFLTAIISLSLAVMNVLPIPALDGGRWFTMLIFKLSKKRLTKEREEKIQMVGFYMLMGLTLLVTLVDVTKLF
ncbi:MAG: M50 family metallopeptidase [Candidatus Saccharimonadales bacterium]